MQSVLSRDASEDAVTGFSTVIHQENKIRLLYCLTQVLEAARKALQNQLVRHIVSPVVYAVLDSRNAQLGVIEAYEYHADSKSQ